MAALVCDICGGKLSMGSGGIAVCDSCGMEHTKERMQEKVQEIKGVVRIDNSHMIENYLGMAQNAYDSNNQAEAESYCNKIIEIDPNNYQAWLLKGKSAGWQSTLRNIRLLESASAFSKAIKCGPESKKGELIEDAKNELTKMGQAIIRLRFDGLSTWLDDNTSNESISEIELVKNAIEKFIALTDENVHFYEMIEPTVNYANQAINNLYSNSILPNYQREKLRDRTNWQSFVGWIQYCIPIMKKLVAVCEISCDYDNGIQISENIVQMSYQAVNSEFWEKEYVFLGTGLVERALNEDSYEKRGFRVDSANDLVYQPYYLDNKGKASYNQIINDYRKTIEKLKNDRNNKNQVEAEKRFIEYWEAHANEKQSLEAEKQSLSVQINELSDEISKIPEKVELANLNSRYEQLSGEKAALSLFKNKEKKAIQEQMDTVNSEISRVKSKLDSAISQIRNRRTPLETRLRDIENELKKGR